MVVDSSASARLRRRRLGRTHMEVTEVACGGVALGSHVPGEEVDDATAVEVVRQALASGINYLDTSPHYRESERRVGLALRALGGRPDGLYLSTKTGTHPLRDRDYSAAATRWSVENSLRLLGVDSVDLLLVHDAEASLEPVFAPDGALAELERMRDEGKLRAIGLGVRSHERHREAIRSGRFNAILTYADYSLVSQTAASLIDEAHDAGVGVIVAQVLLAGLLAGPDPSDRERFRRMPEIGLAGGWWRWANERGVPLQAVATQWVLRNPKVDCVLIGPRTAAEAEENVHLATTQLPAVIWDEVERRIAEQSTKGSAGD
ncbi:MAG: aldo/keto reductase [Chloroflexota bacterium]|nr:MAG: aldo/keto reductase [Chloroflexota bacterium]